MTTVALDVGKTKVRLAAIDERGNEIEGMARPSAARDGPPYPHVDTDELFDWIVDGLRTLARRHEITEIVPIGHGACAALLSGDSLALPVLDYEFTGPEEIGDYELSARRFAETLSPRLPAGLNLGRQLAWQKARFPEAFERADRLLLLPQYWAWRISGVAVSEVTSLGCHTDLWAPRRGVCSDYARSSGVDRLLPPLRHAWDRLGPLRPELAARTGIRDVCGVLAGIHDSNASYFAQRAAREGQFAVVSTGTWVVVMARGARLDSLDEHRDTLGNVDPLGDAVATARFMGGREFAAIAGGDGLSLPIDSADVLATIERGGLVLPTFVSGVGPFRRAKGEIALPSPSSPRERAAAAALYCALVTDVCLDLVGASGEVIVEGPFARNAGILAALAGLRPHQRVLASSDATGTFAGAACLAAWSRGETTAAARAPAALAPASPAAPARMAAHRARWRAAIG